MGLKSPISACRKSSIPWLLRKVQMLGNAISARLFACGNGVDDADVIYRQPKMPQRLAAALFMRVRSRYLFPRGSCQASVETVYDRYHCKQVRRQIGQAYSRRSFVKRIFRRACGFVSRKRVRGERLFISENPPGIPRCHQDFFILKERQSVH